MANPNGDMLNENRPRQDQTTEQLEVSDVRIKRFVRDYWLSQNKRVLVREEKNQKGNVLSCQQIIEMEMKQAGIKEDQLINYLFENVEDVRLFGAVITKPKYNVTGPLQINWSKSVHKAEVLTYQGNAAYASGKGKEQSSIWTKYICPYALFKTEMVFNRMVAQRQSIRITEEMIEDFKNSLIMGMKTYRSTSKNQVPRILVEVVYNNNDINGTLNLVDVKYDKPDFELRSIDDVKFDFAPLKKYQNKKSASIDKITVHLHDKIQPENLDRSSWEIKNV